MKTCLNLIVCIGFFSFLHAQVKRGEVTYKIKFNNTSAPTQAAKKNASFAPYARALGKAEEIVSFKLIFNNTQSLFFKEKMMVSDYEPLVYQSAMAINPGYYYTNIATNEKLKVDVVFDKSFIINVNKVIPWKITEESKKIAGYICHKAIVNEKSLTDGSEYQVEAWFTKQLPYFFGPNQYGALPGLVLELKLNKYTIYCEKINLEPKIDITIKKPEEGEYVASEKEFALIAKNIIDGIKIQKN